MSEAIHVPLETLAGPAASSVLAAAPPPAFASTATFYLETFGCQMNDHDSEKVAGVLLGRGYHAVENPADAHLVLYNTCSIREKAAQKVFARIGDWKTISQNR